MNKFIYKIGFPVFLVLFFVGCNFDWFGGKKKVASSGRASISTPSTGSGEVLLSIDGKPVLKESDYKEYLTQILQASPYFRGVNVDMLPADMKQRLFYDLVNQEVILAWADKNNVEDTPEYQQEFEKIKTLLRRSLLMQQFEKKIFDKISVSDSDVKDEFEKNKKTRYVKAFGGVVVKGIKFENEDKANAFFDKVKNVKNTNEFASLAKKENAANFKDWGRVDRNPRDMMNYSEIPAVIRAKVFSFKNYPAVEKIKIGNTIWVVHASDKKDDIYYDFDEIKPQIEMMLKRTKFKEKFDEKVKELKKDFVLEINDNYFKRLEQREAEKEEPAEIKKEKVNAKKGTAKKGNEANKKDTEKNVAVSM